jgi:orotate phosphoribosyltransferase
VALAALLALVVGVTRLLIGLFRWGFVAYLMSQPVVSAFTAAAALLIVCSQLPALLEVPTDETSPVRAALDAVRDRVDVAAALAGRLPAGVERLAGVALGAVPLVVATSLSTGLPYVIVRKTVKEHGSSAGRGIEGNLRRGERVALIEDVVTTGAQAVEAAGDLLEAGAEVARILAVLDRREELSSRLGGFAFEALLRMEDLGVCGAHRARY